MTSQDSTQNVFQDISQDVWQTQTAHKSIEDYEFDDCIFVEENGMTIYVRTSSGKTISIKCDKKQKAATISEKVEIISTIPRGMTYLAHQGKATNEKKTIEENNIGTETTIEMSLRLLGGMEKSDLMDTLESEEDREKERKLEEMCEGKLTRPSEDAMFLRKEIIDALKRSGENMVEAIQ